MESRMIFVAIIEDDDDIRRGLAVLLDGTPGFRCCGAYRDCESASENIARQQPDVLLLDIELPGISGVEGIPGFKTILPEADIIMLTVHEEDELVFSALCAGASGYLLKTTPPHKLLKAIAEVSDGGAPMSAHIARKVIHSFRKPSTAGTLTPREHEILALLCRGESYKMIAGDLGISQGTVHCHIKNIYKKLQVNSNAQAVANALRNKLV